MDSQGRCVGRCDNCQVRLDIARNGMVAILLDIRTKKSACAWKDRRAAGHL